MRTQIQVALSKYPGRLVDAGIHSSWFPRTNPLRSRTSSTGLLDASNFHHPPRVDVSEGSSVVDA